MPKFIELPLSEIADISRGASTTPDNIKKRTTTEDTGIQYLKLASITDNYMDDDLPFLRDIEDREHKYCLQENDIVLAKLGMPQFALIKNIGTRRIIATQNLYIIKCHEGIAPQYLRAYLESVEGFERLEAAYIKNTIPTLPIKNLEQILIPIIEKEDERTAFQKQFADEYTALENRESECLKLAAEERKKRLTLLDSYRNTK